MDLQTGELRQRGHKVRLQEQPFQVLAALLERPGEVVTRDELRNKLWPVDTFVDFDHGLNAAIKRLRDALGESAETPIFVETVARRGYRFIGNAEVQATSASAPSYLDRLLTIASGPWARKAQFGAALLALVVLACITAVLLFWRQESRWKLTQDSVTLQRLTTNAAENWIIASAISPDGKYLAYSDKTGIYLRLLSTGELHALLPKVSDVTFLGWFPDSTRLLASWANPPAPKSLWAVSIFGGNARQLSEEGWSASVSPDSSQIVFLKGAGFGETGQEIWLMRSNGADQRRVMSFSEGGFASPVWSPDRRWIAYVKFKTGPSMYDVWIELYNLEHGTSRIVLSEQRLTGWGLSWLPDGRLVYAMEDPPPSQNSSNLWAARLDLSKGSFIGTPAKITTGDGFVAKPSVTADSKHLVFSRAKPQADVYISEFSAKGPRLSTPRRLTLDEADDLPFDWTIDNQSVLFISDRTGTINIFRQRIDESSAEMLVADQEKKSAICRLTPDGSQILYSVPTNPSDNLQPVRLMRAPLNGGPPQTVLEAPAIGNFVCSHAPATICAFGQEKPKELVISVFDPAIGEPHEVATLQKQTAEFIGPEIRGIGDWALGAFPGRKVNRGVYLRRHQQPNPAALAFRSTQSRAYGEKLEWLHVPRLGGRFEGAVCQQQSCGFQAKLADVDLAGNAHQIWEVNHVWASWAIPSRNGKYLAILAPTADSNVWMAENF